MLKEKNRVSKIRIVDCYLLSVVREAVAPRHCLRCWPFAMMGVGGYNTIIYSQR